MAGTIALLVVAAACSSDGPRAEGDSVTGDSSPLTQETVPPTTRFPIADELKSRVFCDDFDLGALSAATGLRVTRVESRGTERVPIGDKPIITCTYEGELPSDVVTIFFGFDDREGGFWTKLGGHERTAEVSVPGALEAFITDEGGGTPELLMKVDEAGASIVITLSGVIEPDATGADAEVQQMFAILGPLALAHFHTVE